MAIKTDLQQEYEQIFNFVPAVPEEREYWLIRTQSGELYDSFRRFGYVAIGHEKIKLEYLNEISKKGYKSKRAFMRVLRDQCAISYPDSDSPGLMANQVYRFVYDIKIGDIVIIPSYNSDRVSFGVVTSPVYNATSDDKKKTEADVTKRVKVKWLKDFRRDSLDPYLYRMLTAHQAINNISHYGNLIESSIKNFYVTQGKATMVLEVESPDGISAEDLFEMGLLILKEATGFFKANKLQFNTNDFEVKINLNSPGKIEFSSKFVPALGLTALLLVFIVGGGVKFEAGPVKFDVTTDGAIKKVMDYQSNQHRMANEDALKNHFDSLQAKPPVDITRLVDSALKERAKAPKDSTTKP
jgi:restriction system protein